MVVKNLEKKENNNISFVVEVEKEKFEAAVNSAYLKNKGKIAVPGFRKGKAPRAIIEGLYGAEVFHEDAIEALCPEAYEFAVEEQKLNTVGQPRVTAADVNEEKVLVLTFESALYPEVTLGEYKNLEAPKAVKEVSDEDVAEELERIAKRNARIETVERPAKDGDSTVIDYAGTLDGVPFDGGTAEGQTLVLGSHVFVPGFEEQVVGMSAGEEKDIDITFPEDYHEDLAGKAVVFHVKMKEVKERQLPEIDDEFAKDVSEFDTLEEYKADVRKNLQAEREAEADKDFRTALMEKAIANMQCDVPDAMIEEQMDFMMQQYSQQLGMQGVSLEQYLQMMGVEYSTFRLSSRNAATKQVQSDLLLEKIAEVEGIEATDEDVDADLAKMAEEYGMEVEEIKNAVSIDTMKREIKLNKAADLIYGSGVATEPVAEEEKAE